MREPDEKDRNRNDLMSLARGIESNMRNLRRVREMPGGLPGHVQPLEVALEAQVQLLNDLSYAIGGASRVRRDVSVGDFVIGKCKAITRHNRFIDDWHDTGGDPCLKCSEDKSKCAFYQALAEKRPSQAD